jgi:hypothetical protein
MTRNFGVIGHALLKSRLEKLLRRLCAILLLSSVDALTAAERAKMAAQMREAARKGEPIKHGDACIDVVHERDLIGIEPWVSDRLSPHWYVLQSGEKAGDLSRIRSASGTPLRSNTEGIKLLSTVGGGMPLDDHRFVNQNHPHHISDRIARVAWALVPGGYMTARPDESGGGKMVVAPFIGADGRAGNVQARALSLASTLRERRRVHAARATPCLRARSSTARSTAARATRCWWRRA